MGGEPVEYMDLEYVGRTPARAGPFRQYAWSRSGAPMVTLTRMVDGVPGETIRARWEPGVTIGNAAFFAQRPGEDGKKIGFTVTVPSEAVPRNGGYSIGMEGLEVREVPMWSTDKSHLPGYARALAALQKRGLR